MNVPTSRLLCDVELAPDGAVLVIEDVGAKGLSGVYVHQGGDGGRDARGTACHTLWVHTMSIHECDLVGRQVRVRVLCGSNPGGLGDLAFDGPLEIASGVLAVGDAHNPDRQLLFGTPAIVRVSVFLDDQIETIHFGAEGGDYPLSGPSDVNVLLHGEPGFAHAIGTAHPRRPWRQRPRHRSR